MRFTIPARLPGMNEAFEAARTSKYVEAKTRNQYENLIIWSAKRGLRGWRARGPVFLHYTFYERDRRRDKDNVSGYACKLIQDSLVKGGFLKNDGWAQIENFDFAWDVDPVRPRVEVEIEEL